MVLRRRKNDPGKRFWRCIHTRIHGSGRWPGADLTFDAATIKLDKFGPGEFGMKGGPGTSSPGRVTWRKVWLRDLVATAFRVDPGNVSGPVWISRSGAQLYALTATMPPDTSRHDFELMFQKFLIEQFRIKLHHEPKLFPAYELVVAPGGAKLKASADPNVPDASAVTKSGEDRRRWLRRILRPRSTLFGHWGHARQISKLHAVRACRATHRLLWPVRTLPKLTM